MQKRPKIYQGCEICGRRNLPVVIDGRIRKGEYGPNDHWVYMCPACHAIHGKGWIEEVTILFKFFINKYYEEELGGFKMKPDEIRHLARGLASRATPEDEGKLILMGEMCAQLAAIGEMMVIQNEFSRKMIKAFESEPDIPEEPEEDGSTTFDDKESADDL